jgi:two-component system sensor histidine kinase DegS
LTVQDDGQGIGEDTLPPSEELDDRLGIRGMVERANLIGGQLAIDSLVGQGTTVRLTVQL